MAVRRLSEEGGLNPQLRYVKRGKLCVVEMPRRLRLDPANVIKTVVEKEKPEVVNITAMADRSVRVASSQSPHNPCSPVSIPCSMSLDYV